MSVIEADIAQGTPSNFWGTLGFRGTLVEKPCPRKSKHLTLTKYIAFFTDLHVLIFPFLYLPRYHICQYDAQSIYSSWG